MYVLHMFVCCLLSACVLADLDDSDLSPLGDARVEFAEVVFHEVVELGRELA